MSWRLRTARAIAAAGAVLLGTGCASAAPSPPGTGVPPAASSTTRAPARARPPASRLSAWPGIRGAIVAGTRGVPLVAVRVEAAVTPGSGPVTVLVADLTRLRLVLHAGLVQPPSAGGWRHGPVVTGAERTDLVAAFNGGFKAGDSRGGWRSEGRIVVPLVPGAASLVIYRDGGVDIGTWSLGLPARHRTVASVRQNLGLLVNHGRAQDGPSDAATRWGVAFRGAHLVSRSAVGITADHLLVWVGGTDVTVHDLTVALVRQHVMRAMELDINAPFVRAFLFPGRAKIVIPHGGYPQHPLPLVIGQTQDTYSAISLREPHCTYLLPCARDFFTLLLR